MMSDNKSSGKAFILVALPTYNEAQHIVSIVQKIKKSDVGADILFVDDHSPDGTGEIIDQLVKSDSSLHVIHRPGKLGLGSAHQDAIRWAYQKGYKILITMDCDLSHDPKHFSALLEHAVDYDVVIASRHMWKDGCKNWNIYRKFLTKAGRFFLKNLLELPYDSTIAYRLYQLERIPQGVFDLIGARGYSFMFESMLIYKLNGLKIGEIPIEMPLRVLGKSKLGLSEMANNIKEFIVTFCRLLIKKSSFIYSKR